MKCTKLLQRVLEVEMMCLGLPPIGAARIQRKCDVFRNVWFTNLSNRPAGAGIRLNTPVRPHYTSAFSLWQARLIATASTIDAPTTTSVATTAFKLQPLDYTSLVACAAELKERYCPSYVEQAIQATPHSLFLRLRTIESVSWLSISWDASHAHLSIRHDLPRRSTESESFSFGQQANSALKGTVLSEISLPNKWDRILQLCFASRLGDETTNHLVCELMGRYSNIVLTTAADPPMIVAAARQVGVKMTQQRYVQTGKSYAAPPTAPGLEPTMMQTAADLKAVAVANCHEKPQPLWQTLVRSFSGVSPSLAHEFCSKAGISAGGVVEPKDVSEKEWEGLFTAWQDWLERLESGRFCVTSGSHGEYSVLGEEGGEEDGSSVLAFMQDYYGNFIEIEEFERVKQRVQHCIHNSMRRIRSKCHSLKQQAERSSDHSSTSKTADMIMANLYSIPQGAASFEAEDWDTGKMVTIQLDPLKAPAAVAESLYGKARKTRRGAAQIEPLLEEAEKELGFLAETELMVQQLDGSQDLAALLDVEAELMVEGYIKSTQPANSSGKTKPQQQRSKKAKQAAGDADSFRRFTTPGGMTVLIGRNSRQNEELTLKKGQPNDIWMHARGVPGAHVLLVLPSGTQAGDEDVQFAADLAIYYSKARTEVKADVTCASPADIRKPKGAKTGQVLVAKETVVVGRPDRSIAASNENN